MDDEVEFQRFLTTIGLPDPQSRTNVSNNLADTFRGLLQLSNSDIKSFVRETNDRNRNLRANQQLSFATNHATSLRAMLFELRNRYLCDALPNVHEFAAIDDIAVDIMRTEMIEADLASENRDASNTPSMEVKKLKQDN